MLSVVFIWVRFILKQQLIRFAQDEKMIECQKVVLNGQCFLYGIIFFCEKMAGY